MTLTIAADAVVATLLVATIFYASILNRRLAVLRGDRAELQTLVQNLGIASQQAEAGVAALKVAAEEVGRQLEKKVDHAQSLRDDLSYMVDRGGTVADRLEGTIRARRDEPKPETARPRPTERPRPAELPRQEPQLRRDSPLAGAMERVDASMARPVPGSPSRAERDLLRALAGRR